MNQSSKLGDSSTRRPGGMTTLAWAVLLSSLAGLTGCTSAAFKPAPKTTPPAVLLNLPFTQPPFEVLLHTVIVYRGAGSWKRDAYWDEYVMTIANRGNAMIAVDSASLMDFQGQTTAAGADPWGLEKASRALAAQAFSSAKEVVVQLGGGATALAAGSGAAAVIFGGGSAAVAVGGVFVLPAYVGISIYSNIKNRHAIEREFERRRLVLPAELVPGQVVQGSLFFRIAPGPRRLTLQCRVDNEPRNIAIDLAPLAGLHLKSPPAASAPARMSP